MLVLVVCVRAATHGSVQLGCRWPICQFLLLQHIKAVSNYAEHHAQHVWCCKALLSHVHNLMRIGSSGHYVAACPALKRVLCLKANQMGG